MSYCISTFELVAQRFEIASRPVTNQEYLAFVVDNSYQHHDLWLSLGGAAISERATRAHEWERFDKPLRLVPNG